MEYSYPSVGSGSSLPPSTFGFGVEERFSSASDVSLEVCLSDSEEVCSFAGASSTVISSVCCLSLPSSMEATSS